MTTRQRSDQHDKQVAAIRKLIREGMRLVLETRKDMRAFAAAKKQTKRGLEALRRRNGHGERRVTPRRSGSD